MSQVLSLQAMREQQKAAGLAPDVYTPEPEPDSSWSVTVAETSQPSLTSSSPQAAPKSIVPGVVRVQQIQTPARGLRGYTRILPPGKRSVAELTGDWIIEFWDKPSPWCSIEGEPVHPEFDNNLKSFENAI